MKFAANISTMFRDAGGIADRFNEAKMSGFSAVEAQSLYNEDLLSCIIEEKRTAEIPLVLMNSPHKPAPFFPEGDYSNDPLIQALIIYATSMKSMGNIAHQSIPGEKPVEENCFGMACLPDNRGSFYNSIQVCTKLADLLDCRKMHILAGITPDQSKIPYDVVKEVYKENIKWAANHALEYNMQILIEPICPKTKEGYFLNSFEQAVEVIEQSGKSNIKLLLDVYHLYEIEHTVESSLRKYLPYAGHIQISQSPGRIDPFKEGDIDYARVLQIIRESSYDGYIGLEYTPADAEPDFSWIANYAE